MMFHVPLRRRVLIVASGSIREILIGLALILVGILGAGLVVGLLYWDVVLAVYLFILLLAPTLMRKPPRAP